jgi:hypothetical protein
LGAEKLEGAAADPLAATVTSDEELAKVNQFGLFAEERVGDDCTVLLVDHGAILACEPATHPPFEFRHAHPIAVSFVQEELMVQLGEERAVVQSGRPEIHGALLRTGAFTLGG